MLCPSVNDVSERLADAYSNTIRFKGYAYQCNNIRIAKLTEDPDWLPPVRNRLSLLSDQSGLWMQEAPDIWSQVLLSFITYHNLFEGFAGNISSYTTKDQWLQVLERLLIALDQSQNATETATETYKSRYIQFQNLQLLLDQSINAGWAELGDEIKQITAISAQIQKLTDKLNGLQDDISAIALKSGQSYMQSSLSIAYSLVTVAGSSVSFLSMAGLAFTIGKTFYDIFHNNAEIADTVNKLGEAQMKASYLAQAAAATQLVLRTCYHLEKQFLGLQKSLPYLTNMWENEKGKVKAAIDALQSGSDPAQLFELQSMPSAVATWKTLAGYANLMMKPAQEGQPVVISIPNTNSSPQTQPK